MDALTEYRNRIRIAMNSVKMCVFEMDLSRQLYTFFENAEGIFGVSGEEILRDMQAFSRLAPKEYRKRTSAYFSHPDDEPVIEKAFRGVMEGRVVSYEARMRARGSDFVWCSITVTPILENGVPVRIVGVVADITDVKETTDNLRLAVRMDSFTGLYNKEYAIAAIRSLLRTRPQRQHALLLLDIDRFKHFNDTYGHAEGDRIILAMAKKIKESFRKTDVMGRFGGDEFIILVQDIPGKEWLCSKLDGLSHFGAQPFECTASIGVALFPGDSERFEELFEMADKALYHVKTVRERYAFYHELGQN